MEQITPTGSEQPTVQQMFATLLGEVATLRRQNEDQQRQLEHLRNTTSVLLERDNFSLQSSAKLQFKHLPTEIREMIWELAMPHRLLGFKSIEPETGVPSTLSIPAIAHVCQESRCVFMAQNRYMKARDSNHPTPLWRLKENRHARWTSFAPHADALLINPHDFLRTEWETNYPMASMAEHIVVEWCELDASGGFERGYEKAITKWIKDLVLVPDYSPEIERGHSKGPPLSTTAPVCHLRIVDFAVSSVTKVDKNYPPNFVHRLFGGDRVKIVDLRDRETVNEIKKMMYDELSPTKAPITPHDPMPGDLEDSLDIFRAAAHDFWKDVKNLLLSNLVKAYYSHSIYSSDRRGNLAYLLKPVMDGRWDTEVPWVNELYKRIDVRPVHVFVRADGISNMWY